MGCCGGIDPELTKLLAVEEADHCCQSQQKVMEKMGVKLIDPKAQTMTLARALTYKKRVAERLSQVEENILIANSVIAGTEREVDVDALIQERRRLVGHMIDLKLKIMRATDPIRGLILSLAEFKSENEFYQRITTTHGAITNPYGRFGEGAAIITYDAVVRKSDVDELTRKNNANIDQTQEEIERHNYNTKITVEDIGL